MKHPTKVVFLLSSLKFGGGERVALNLAHAFKDMGLRVDFLLMSHEGEFLAEARHHFTVVDLACDRTWKLPGKLAGYLWRQRPDVLIASFWKLNLCACLARLAYPLVRLLLWEHSPPSKSANSPTWLYALTASVLYRLGTKVIAVSNGVRADIERITLGLKGRVQVIFNAIPPPDARGASQPLRENGHNLLWVGRLDSPKNPGLMLEAFALLPIETGYTLDFIGDGPLRPALEQRRDQLGLQGRVHFRGFQSRPYDWLAQSDLLVLTSDREGLGNVLIEALYCGLRIVSTDCGSGINEILLDGTYGTVVPVRDPQAMASAIEAELRTPVDRLVQMAGAQRFSPSLIAGQFLIALGLRAAG